MSDQILQRDYKVNVAVKHFEVAIPPQGEPAWASVVARWHQLDESTYAVVEAAYRYSKAFPKEWELVRPKSIWIAAPGGSNIADDDFVVHGSRSPSRFVGTLPSIRSSSLALLMNWRGPVMCLQNGEKTLLQGFEEVYWHLISSYSEPAWLITSTRIVQDQNISHRVSFFCFGSDAESDFEFLKVATANNDVFLSHLSLIAQSEASDVEQITIGLGLTLMRKM
jgi:hypothetical protein